MTFAIPAADPGYLLARVGSALRTELTRLLARWQLRPLQFHILTALNSRPGLSHRELCELLGVTNAHLVSLLDGLRAMDYATRSPDRDYHPRRYLITITASGREAVSEASRAVAECTHSFLSPLSQPELLQLTMVLGKLLETGKQPGHELPAAEDNGLAWP
jgi:DNA-binding MarR family transcriptional regulator